MGFGVYVHIPFCARRCDYCDFATWTDRDHLMGAYIGACITDVTRRYAAGNTPAATSVFFGGGTPSLLPAADLVRILDAIPRRAGAEVTVECNPDTVTLDRLRCYHDHGVTRLSLGVQSFVPHVLRALGRTHDTAQVRVAVDAARATGFDTFNLDLIYGAAGETIADWETTVMAALALEPPHISAYALTVESGTPLARRIGAGEVDAPDDDDQAAKYVVADELLSVSGRDWYEISNWARPGHACRHNLLYWSQGDYLGIGCAAHGHTAGRRWWTVRTPERYIERVRTGGPVEAGDEVLDAATREEERLALSLRTRAGATIDDGAGVVAAGLAERAGGRLVLTRTGRLLASDVTARLLLARAPV